MFPYRLKSVLWVGYALFALVFPEGRGAATIMDPLLWEQLVAGADLVGVVECQTAGGMVARYRIIDSWKGPPVGEEITIEIPTLFMGPQFPTVLCGEKYLVTAFSSSPPSTLISTFGGGSVPLWWRNLKADYQLPFGQGIVSSTSTASGFFYSNCTTLEEFKEQAQRLIEMPPEERERVLLRRLTQKYLFGIRRRGASKDFPDPLLSANLRSLQNKMDHVTKASQLIRLLLDYAKDHVTTDGAHYRVPQVLKGAGGAQTLALLCTFA